MKQDDFDNLRTGDAVRHIESGNSYLVIQDSNGGCVLLIRAILAIQANEWELIRSSVPLEYLMRLQNTALTELRTGLDEEIRMRNAMKKEAEK